LLEVDGVSIGVAIDSAWASLEPVPHPSLEGVTAQVRMLPLEASSDHALGQVGELDRIF